MSLSGEGTIGLIAGSMKLALISGLLAWISEVRVWWERQPVALVCAKNIVALRKVKSWKCIFFCFRVVSYYSFYRGYIETNGLSL